LKSKLDVIASRRRLSRAEPVSKPGEAISSCWEKIVSENEYCVYIMTNAHNTVLYTGVTNNLQRRVLEHKSNKGSSFTKKYNVTKLVYFESGNDVNIAIAREKQIKAGSRRKKMDLINNFNPEWKDLFEEYFA
jgi:putative endonuclease